MTAAVQEFADHAWATADNPRAEQLGQIFSDMQPGVKDAARITFVEDRRRAISLALDAAREGDCLLIAGKGHETCQEFADTIILFDDRQVVRELIGIKSIQPA
jgi:UDP-N-acetylmuramoyl-L-alanyl-D-glutamate--2,6-diaminopimelate ligase